MVQEALLRKQGSAGSRPEEVGQWGSGNDDHSAGEHAEEEEEEDQEESEEEEGRQDGDDEVGGEEEVMIPRLRRRADDDEEDESRAMVVVVGGSSKRGDDLEPRDDGPRVLVSELLAAVDVIWPDQGHQYPKPWALNKMAKYLIIRAAWQARHSRGSGGGSSAQSPSTPSAAEPRTLKATIALGGLSGISSTPVSSSELAAASALLSRVGAELGLEWRSKEKAAGRTSPYEVRLGQVRYAGSPPSNANWGLQMPIGAWQTASPPHGNQQLPTKVGVLALILAHSFFAGDPRGQRSPEILPA